MSKKPTREEIAESYDLWTVYVDVDGHDTIEHFDAMSVEERLTIMAECFGAEDTEE